MDKPGQSAGLELRPAHFPGRAPIDAYGNGGFRFADMSHKGSLMCLPSGIYGWHVEAPGDLRDEHFDRVVEEAKDVEVFLLGMGNDFLPIPKALRPLFKELSIVAEPMSTGSAVRTFNVLLSEGRAIGCGLIAV